MLFFLALSCKWIDSEKKSNGSEPSEALKPLTSEDVKDERQTEETKVEILEGSLPSTFEGFVNQDNVYQDESSELSSGSVPVNEEDCRIHPEWKWEKNCIRKTFFDYCLERANLAKTIKDTMDHLSKGDDCTQNYKLLQKLSTLDLSNKQISSLAPLYGLTGLKKLVLAKNNLRNLSVISQLKSLISLDISKNSIEHIEDLKSLTNLIELNISYNPIKSVFPLKELHALQKLNASFITANDLVFVGDLIKLEYLSIAGNGLTDINFLASLKNLLYLQLDDNSIRDIHVIESFPKLSYLYLNINKIEEISALGRSPRLKTLEIAHNQIKEISLFSQLPDLEELDLSNNKIEYMTFDGYFSKLTYLNISDNPIKYVTIPIKGLPLLRELRMRNCEISDFLPLTRLSQLELVDLRGCTKKIDDRLIFDNQTVQVWQ